MRKIAVFAAALLLAVFSGLVPARAEDEPSIVAQVSISQQMMIVSVDGLGRYYWPVSTARRGYITPKGSWGV